MPPAKNLRRPSTSPASPIQAPDWCSAAKVTVAIPLLGCDRPSLPTTEQRAWDVVFFGTISVSKSESPFKGSPFPACLIAPPLTKTSSHSSINVDRFLAVMAPLRAPEKLVSAVGAVVAFLLFLHPSLGSILSPEWNRAQYHLFTHRKREILDIFAGEIIALMTPLDALLNCA